MSKRLRVGDLFYLIVGVCIGVSIGVALSRFWLFRPKPLVLEVPTPPPPPPTPTPSPIEVYVSGAVLQPGVYSLPPGARVADAVEAAGGLAQNANANAINLARTLTDGEHVYVPAEGEKTEVSFAEGDQDRKTADQETSVEFPVNVNTASAGELQAIPGIGPALAARIIADRPYGSVDDLLRVKGIGPATLEKIRPYVTVEE